MSALTIEELQSSADQGNLEAIMECAMRFKSGQGCDQDLDEAIHYLAEAVDKGSAEAERELGICYSYGIGVDQDDEMATSLFRRAGGKGDTEAMFRLAQNLSTGTGCDLNIAEADKWLGNAARMGHARAQETMQSLIDSGKQAKDLVIPDRSSDQGSEETFYPVLPGGNTDVYPVTNTSVTEQTGKGIGGIYRKKGLFLLIYMLAGALSGYLLKPIYGNGVTKFGAESLVSHFSSLEHYQIYTVIAGGVIGLLCGLIMSYVYKRVREGLIAYLPLLFLPIIVLFVGSVAAAVGMLAGSLVKSVVSAVASVAGIIIGLVCLYSTSSGG